MSRFGADFADWAHPALLEEFGRSVNYTPAGGAAAAVTAIVRELESTEAENEDGPVVVYRLQVEFQDSDVADPGRGDRLVYRGQTWSFDQRLARRASGWFVCQFVRTVPINKTRAGREIRR